MFVKMVSGIAASEDGADRIFSQMIESARNQFRVTKEDFKYLSMDFILKSFVDLCSVLILFAGKNTVGMAMDEVPGFAAYLRLFG